MKRLAIALLALAAPAYAEGAWTSVTFTQSGPHIPAGSCGTFRFDGDDASNVQPAVSVPPGELAFTSVATSGAAISVSFYELPIGVSDDSDPAAETSATLRYTATGTTSDSTYKSTNGGIL